jgi:thiol-disulfide isomerase/thioredoxin
MASRLFKKAKGEAAAGKTKDILSDPDFQRELVAAGERLVVVNFSAVWCAPCKKIAPAFVRLSEEYVSAVFLKVDTDICRGTARKYGVESTPTFTFFMNRQRIKGSDVKGANEVALEAAIIKQTREHQEATDVVEATITVPGQVNLASLIDHSGSECLNESDDHPFTNCLRTNAKYLESDCDPQLIIVLAFMQAVKLHTMQIIAPTDGRAPKTVKLFINQPQTLDFDTAEQSKPLQEFTLTEESVLEDSKIPLSFVKFQNVQKLTIFVQDNQGGEETSAIRYLGLYGSPLDTTNMSDFKRTAGEKGERHA